jgi:hypothetical protein
MSTVHAHLSYMLPVIVIVVVVVVVVAMRVSLFHPSSVASTHHKPPTRSFLSKTYDLTPPTLSDATSLFRLLRAVELPFVIVSIATRPNDSYVSRCGSLASRS